MDSVAESRRAARGGDWRIIRFDARHAPTGDECIAPTVGAVVDAELTMAGSTVPVDGLRRLLDMYRTPWLILVRAGLLLPERWDRRLVLAASQDPRIGAVSPLNNALALLTADPVTRSDEADRIDRRVYALGDRGNHQMPLFWPDCVCFARAALTSVLDELDKTADWHALCRALNTAGFAIVVCDHLYVHDPEAESGNEAAPASSDAELIERVHPLNALRHHLRDACARGLDYPDALPPRPVQLHVVHSWGGGLGRWVDDYIAADTQRTNLVLRSIGIPGVFGERLDLCTHYHAHEPLRSWVLNYPIRATALVHLQYAAILQSVIEDFAVQGLIVSSLIGHSLDVLRTELPTVQVLHDYHPFCPALNVWFEQPCQSCTSDRLAECFAHNPTNRYFTTSSAPDWLPLRHAWLTLVGTGKIRLVAPSASVRAHLRELAPEIPADAFAVIPHGIAWPATDSIELETVDADIDDRPLRIVVPGRLSIEKGRDLLEQLLPMLCTLGEVHLLGCGETGQRFASQPNVTVTAHYPLEELPERLRAMNPDLGLLLSRVPETFGYTLSELQAAAIPVLATAIGSYNDRIEDGVSGFLAPPDAEALRQRLLELYQNRALLRTVQRHLAGLPIRGRDDMVRDYHQLLSLDAYSSTAYFGARIHRSLARDDRALPVSVRGDLTYRQALAGFLDYTRRKIEGSPRLGYRRKRLLLGLSRWLSRVLTGQRAEVR